MYPRIRLEGDLEVVCPPLRWCCGWEACAVPAFAPGSLEVTVGFFGLFVSLVQTSGTTAHARLFLVPYNFFRFYCWRGELYLDANIAVKDPRSRFVSKQLPGLIRRPRITPSHTCHSLQVTLGSTFPGPG